MNRFYFHFGDYYNDGHGCYKTICVETPKSKAEIQAIINKVDFMHPAINNPIGGLANTYCEPHFDSAVWIDIIEKGYPYERFMNNQDDCGFEQYSGWEDLSNKCSLLDIVVTIETVVDVYLFLLNHYGAELTVLIDDTEHFSFEYGYGCFL